MGKIKIILVDDHTIVRQGLSQAIQTKEDFKVVGEADNGRVAIELALLHAPDIVIMDVSMPDLNGIEATKQILANNSNVKVIVLSMYSEKIYVIGMLNAGASAYLLKTCSFRELHHAINIVLSGKTYLCPDVAHLVVNKSLDSNGGQKTSLLSVLSQREREVLQLIAEGHQNKAIAVKLKISNKTVENHRANLKNKLDIHSTAELTKFSIAEGVTAL
jgi:DNA-binding NarL/FixJ family response regulator